MSGFDILFSPKCCGGPVLLLSVISAGFGVLFLMLAAFELGAVFISVGLIATGLCLYLGASRCHRNAQTHFYI